MRARRFPWAVVLGLWVVLSGGLVALYWQMAATLNFADPDDFLRLQQVRDLLNGQSWFDLTQHRIAPPGGLAMHWSRLVDMPVLAFLAPLRPLVGQPLAEVVAVIAAPLLTLLALLIATVATTRRLFGPDKATAVLACFLTLSASTIFSQIHPARIDHHGWQIVFAAAAVAALLQRDARLSGIGAGVSLALYLNISIEGAPFVAAALGIVGLHWALGRKDDTRLASAVWTLFATTLVSTVLTAPATRWTEGLCDAVMPSHIAAMGVAAVGVTLAVRMGARTPVARIAMLGTVLVLTILLFGMAAPACIGSPFGRMDPVVDKFWYHNVIEGMPVWRQDRVAVASMIGFPVIAAVGTVGGLLRASSPEMRRRWTIILALLIVALLTGAMVRRAAGIAHVLAVPGALVLIGGAVRYAEGRLPSLLRVLAIVLAVLCFSPIMPVFAVAAFTPPPAVIPEPITEPCDRNCVLGKLAQRAPETLLTSIDLGPLVVFRTPHSAFGAGYHRLEKPLRGVILFFQGSPDQGRAFMKSNGLRTILISPASEEAQLFAKNAPGGMMARLAAGRVPEWLVEDKAGSSALRVYRVRD